MPTISNGSLYDRKNIDHERYFKKSKSSGPNKIFIRVEGEMLYIKYKNNNNDAYHLSISLVQPLSFEITNEYGNRSFTLHANGTYTKRFPNEEALTFFYNQFTEIYYSSISDYQREKESKEGKEVDSTFE